MPTSASLQLLRRAATLLVTGFAWVAPLAAQDPLTLIGERTEVRSLKFRFEDHQTIPEPDLRARISLTARGGMVGLRRLLGFLPFVPPIGHHPFDPASLQRDVVRLRLHYRKAGFLHTRVDYDVEYEAKSDLVDVEFVIREGEPLMVDSLDFAPMEPGSLTLASELEEPWRTFVQDQRSLIGQFGDKERAELADSTSRWLRDRGYPFAVAAVRAAVDSAANRAHVTVAVRSGVRARIAAIEVEGNRFAPARHYTRQLPTRPGDWYSAAKLEEGRKQLVQLDLIRLVVLGAPRLQQSEPRVTVPLQITENTRRVVKGDAGFASDGGITAQVDWTTRNWLGGLRSLSVAGLAQTGALAFEDPPQILYRLGLTAFQPYVAHRHLSLAGGPFVEYRDDVRDRSWAVGLEGSLVYAVSPLRSISLGYTISHRHTFDYSFGPDLDPIEILPILGLATPGAVDTLAKVVRRSAVSLQASYGKFDEFTYPRRGYVVRPRVEITLPSGFNTSEYLLLDFGGSAFVPLTRRIGFAFRGAAGRIFPYGKSVTAAAEESPFVSLLRLRDVTFTAGGTRDVRGWGSQLVGPKLPEIETVTENGQSTITAERYTPVGGLARLTGSIELRLPLPGFSDSWETFVFLDGGRIWTPDRRFALNAGDLDQDDYFFGTGAGISFRTVVGAVQLALGYKLNPSALDIRDPAAVLDALSTGQPLSSVPTESKQRLHLHFAIGTTF
jgi:outer membrane protein insertion porin family